MTQKIYSLTKLREIQTQNRNKISYMHKHYLNKNAENLQQCTLYVSRFQITQHLLLFLSCMKYFEPISHLYISSKLNTLNYTNLT
jgi:hypothetical protein